VTTKRVSRDVYARTGQSDSIYDGWGANQGFVTTDEGVLVVDTGFTRKSAEGLLGDVVKTSRAPVRFVVNTHDHSDHVFGNSVFDRASPLIVSHSNCKSRLVEMGEERMTGYRSHDSRLESAMRGLVISPPNVTYDKEMEFDLGRTPVRLLHPQGGAHTSGDTMVLLPEEGVLFAGDVLWAKYHPNLEDANFDGWIEALERISKMDVDVIVPGHGPVTDKSAIAPLADYLLDFDAKLRRLVLEGTQKKAIAGQLLMMPGTAGWKLKMIVARNVEMLYERYLDRKSPR
jgi:cyclase